MKILERYVAKTVLGATGLVTLLLTGLQIFILLVNQIGDIGKEHYSLAMALWYVLFQLPWQVYLFFPIACLLGSLTGLGLLASSSELVVMRAAGMSMGQITLAVFKAALVMILLVTLMSETIVPKLSRYAHDSKMTALTGGQTFRTNKGIWLRQHLDFIQVATVLPDSVMEQVYHFHFDESHRLQKALAIREIRFEQDHWQAYGIKETVFNKNNIETHTYDSMPWDVPLKPQLLDITSIEPDEMTLSALYRFMRLQKNSHQNIQNYELAFWQRLLQPFSTLLMMFLAIPFIFGPLRSSTMGAKILLGATVGFGFHIINKFMGPVSLVFQWPPLLAALGPLVLFTLLGVYVVRKVQ